MAALRPTAAAAAGATPVDRKSEVREMLALPVETPGAWQWSGYSFRAMNTKVQTWLYSNQTDSSVLIDVQRLFRSVEKRLSRFDPNSELSLLNRCAQACFQASPTLLDAVEVALWAAQATGGLYDPTILDALEQAGYDRSFEQIETGECACSALSEAQLGSSIRPRLGFRAVSLNRVRREIIKPPGLRLDLGGMGKGWTVDRAADRLQGLGPFLINAGGDIFAYHSPPGQKGWEINLTHPSQPDRAIARLYLHHRALATSTIGKRRWWKDGRLMHHLIDPRTGRPGQTDALSVSVMASRAVLADIYAKITLLLGTEAGLLYLQTLPEVEGLIFTGDARIHYTTGFEAALDRLDPGGYSLVE